MTLMQAIDIIARARIAQIVASDEGGWESFPEIGESDWEMIESRMRGMVSTSDSVAETEEAMKIFKARVREYERAETGE